MSVSREDVLHIAKLAKLKLEDDEIIKYTKELNRILKYIDKLQELNTENVEPLSHPIENVNVFREDKIEKSASRNLVLENAPNANEEFFKVPKVIKTP